jgi:hypothetical protein
MGEFWLLWGAFTISLSVDPILALTGIPPGPFLDPYSLTAGDKVKQLNLKHRLLNVSRGAISYDMNFGSA